MITRDKLTGRVRARPQFFSSKLVLQVEVRRETIGHTDLMPFAAPPGVDAATWEERTVKRIEVAWRPLKTFWRDAAWDDLQPMISGQLGSAQ